MKVICKECFREFEDINYIKGQDESKICHDCRSVLDLAMQEDDYSIFQAYLKDLPVSDGN